MNDLIALAKDFGPVVVIIAFFIWRDYKREARMTSELSEINKFIQDKLMTLIERTITAIDIQTESNRQLHKILSRRPYLREEDIDDGK